MNIKLETKLLAAGLIMVTILFTNVYYAFKPDYTPFSKPYIIYLNQVDESDLAYCKSSLDCMDVLSISDLPKREALQ